MKRNLILHLGAHKTATTYIQDTLSKNNDILNGNNIYCIPRDEFRNEVSRVYFYPNNLGKKLDFSLSEYLDNKGVTAKNIILSEENLIGLVQEQIDSNLYGSAHERLIKLKKFIGADFEIKSVLFTVRDYSSYYPSLYCETLKAIKYYPFNKVRKTIYNLDISWLGILEDIDDVFEGRLSVLTYEDFRTNEDEFFKVFLFQEDIQFTKINGKVRQGFGAEVVDVLALFNKKYGKDYLNINNQKKIISSFSQFTSSKFAPFTKLEAKMLSKAYESDLEIIQNKFKYKHFK